MILAAHDLSRDTFHLGKKINPLHGESHIQQGLDVTISFLNIYDV